MKRIVTHPGVFHADDVCAVAWLRMIGVAYLVERRNPTAEELLDESVIVVDVGGRHEPRLYNFDHHQKGGAGSRWDSGVPYAGFGLVFDAFRPNNTDVGQRFHDQIVLAVDAADTGWSKAALPAAAHLSFSACVSLFNPQGSVPSADRDSAFEAAVDWVMPVLQNALYDAGIFVAARDEVMKAETAVPQDSQRRALVLDKFVPWDEHVFSRPDAANLLYVIFPSERGGWMLQQVPKVPGSFEGRKPLPADWAGLRDEALRKLTGVADATFCHPGRFCGGAETKAGALDMARLAVES